MHPKKEEKNGYAIASIKENGVHIATKLLVGKLMRKCRTNKVLASVIMLAEKCVKGV